MLVKADENFIYLLGVPASEKSVMEIYHAAVYSKAKKHWRLPRNHYVMRELYQTFPDLRSNENFNTLGKEIFSHFQLRLAARKMAEKLSNDPEGQLRPYQYQDLNYLIPLEAGGIFNEPRTGKTPVAIRLMERLGQNRNLVVCPASLIYAWEAEVEKWWPSSKVFVYAGPRRGDVFTNGYWRYVYDRKKPAVLIMSKDTLKRDISKLDEYHFDTMFVDEAHFLRNTSTAQSEAIYRIGLHARRRFAMTGTPTVEHPADIVGILKFLYPKQYTSYWQVCARYFQINKSMHGPKPELGWPKPHREKELKEIVGLLSVQRKRKEVMPWLPDKTFKTIACELTPKQRKLYEEMKEFFVALDEDTETEIDAENIISQFMRMRQLCLDPRLLGFDVRGAKTDALMDYLSNHREPVIIMSMFTSYLQLIKPEIEKMGLRVGEINGEIPNTKKKQAVDAFQAGKLDVLLCNIISAGVGYTLDRSNCVIFTDRAWTPIDNSQAEDRVCPTSIERNHAHVIIDLEGKKTIDKRVNNILRRKSTLVQFINEGGREAVRELLSEG